MRTFQLLMHGDMRVPEQDQTGVREIPGVQQRVERVFHTVAVSVRSEDPYAADRKKRRVRMFRLGIAVSADTVEQKCGKGLADAANVTLIVAEMKYGVRFCGADCAEHAVGVSVCIGKNGNFHGKAPPIALQNIVYHKRLRPKCQGRRQGGRL